jgi:ATP-dependent Clp protease ATP-binding subunit ClpC
MTPIVQQLPFTTRTYLVLAIARGIAAGQGHTGVTPHHLALAIIREAESPAAVAMRVAGAVLAAVRCDLEEALPEDGRPRFREVLLPSSSIEDQLVAHAESEAIRLGHRWIGAEHLLLALVRDPDTPIAVLLARHGVTHTPVSDALLSMIRPHT